MVDQKEKISEQVELVSNIQKNYVLVEWEAPARIYKKRGREYFSTIAAIVFLLTIILLILREFLLIGVVLTLAFFTYVLATVEPPKVKNQLTKKGIRIFKSFFRWEELTAYWIEFKYGYAIIHITMPLRLPGRVILLVEKGRVEKIVEVLSDKLIYYEAPQRNWIDRAANWLSHKVRLESPELAHK